MRAIRKTGPRPAGRLLCLLLAVLLLCGSAGLAATVKYSPVSTAPYRNGGATGLYIDPDGLLYVTDSFHKRIWTVAAGEEPELLAGREGVADLSGETLPAYHDGAFADAAFGYPWAVTPFLDGYLVSDASNHVVRMLSSDRQVYGAVGAAGRPGLANGRGSATRFAYPTGLATDDEGAVYIADTQNHCIRKLDTNGDVTTCAGGLPGYADGATQTARFREPMGLCWRDGVLYVADTGNHVIRAIRDGEVSTVAGALFEEGTDAYLSGDYRDGPAAEAFFSSPTNVLMGADGTLYIADSGNAAIRTLRNGAVDTLLSKDNSGSSIFPVEPMGLAMRGNRLYVADQHTGLVYELRTGDISHFTDLGADAWYTDAVSYAVQSGFMAGTGADSFSPDMTVTRGMFAQILANYYGIRNPHASMEAVPVFTDVASWMYYRDAVYWVASVGIASGVGSGRFAPDDAITRESIAVMLLKSARLERANALAAGRAPEDIAPGMTWPEDIDAGEAASLLAPFADSGAISSWARKAMVWAVANGLMAGDDHGRLLPGGFATRAVVAQLLVNLDGTSLMAA